MTPAEIIKAAIPDATPELCEHIMFGRTPFPFGAVTVKSIYRAADRYRRAVAAGRSLCDFCDNLEGTKRKWLCDACATALS